MFNSVTCVTTFNQAGYDRYGRHMVESWIKHWPADFKLKVYVESMTLKINDPRVEVIDLLNACPSLVEFKHRHKDNPKAHGKLKTTEAWGKHFKYEGFFWDAVKFSHKVYAWCDAMRKTDSELVLWIDADCRTFAPVSLDFWNKLLPDNTLCYHLGRENQSANYSETGFVGFNMKHPQSRNFADCMQSYYDKDTVFDLECFTDCHVLDDSIRHFKELGHRSYDIVKELKIPGAHVFINSPLGSIIDHLKGPRKDKGTSHAKDLKVKRSEAYWQKVH